MMPASFFSSPRRRTVVFVAVIGALHYMALEWLTSRASMVPLRPDGAQVVSMALLAAPPEPQPLPVPPPPPELPVPKPRLPPPPPLTDLPSSESAQLTAPASEAPPGPVTPAPPAAGAPAITAPAPAPAVAEVPAPAPAPPPPAVEQARRYKTNAPASAQFDLHVDRRDADGTKWQGVASMAWDNQGATYQLKLEVGLSMLITRINLLVLTSEGLIDGTGIVPVTATEKRKGRAQTATHFNRDSKLITFSATTATAPWQEGAQDKASVPFQLAAIGRADVNQLAGNIDILVGEEKEATVFRFQLVGEEELDTRMGRLVTWHVRRPPKPGTYSSQLDIWLAPSMQWYPVQIRNTEASGALTTQTVTKISVNDATGK